MRGSDGALIGAAVATSPAQALQGGTVARAKRTDRAEARRRYRQTVATEEATFDDVDPTTGAAAVAPAARANRAAAKAAPAPAPTRPGLIPAFRSAIQPAPIMDDLRALPQIVFRTKAFVLPAALSVASGAAFLISGSSQNVVGALLFQAFVVPPPMAASFLGGLFAPRAAWAVGGLVGLAASIVFAVVAVLYPESASTAAGTVANTMAQRQEAILFAFLTAPMLGIAIGAFAGFYRRFLRSSGAGQQPRSNRQKRAASRR
jgi:hypothetical protein